MIKIAICDDDKEVIEQYEQYIEKMGDKSIQNRVKILSVDKENKK